MTTRLYRQDAYQSEFTSTVLERRQRGDTQQVRLEATAFYPTAGGQAFDTGTLGGVRVTEVQEDDDGTIWHTVEGSLEIGSSLMGTIDWAHRLDHMRQHTGEHILGQAFYRLGLHVVAVNMEGKVCTLDLGGDVSWERATEAEGIANDAILAAHPISAYEVPDTEIGRVPLRRTPKVSGLIRVVQIGTGDKEAYDYSACGGTHLRNSAEVGMLKVFKLERARGTDTRVYFNCGGRLLPDYRFKHDFVAALGLRFSTALESVPERTNLSLDELNALKREVTNLRGRLAQEIVSNVSEQIVVLQLEDAALLPDLAKAFAAKPGVVAVLGALAGPRAVLSVACGPGAAIKAGELLKLGLPLIDGRGGGKPDLAQGSGTNFSGLTDALEAMRKAVS